MNRVSSVSPAGFSNLRRSLRRQGGKRQKRISAILRGFSHRDRTEPTIGELSQAFDTRAFGAFFILFGGLNLVPLPPPASFFLGLPLMFFTIQLAIGRHRLWLPDLVRRMRLSPQRIAQVMQKIGPMLRRIERLARHRYWIEPERLLLSVVGWYCFVMSIVVAIPFPFSNLIPGISIALVGVAISARDGLWLIAALIVGIIGVAVLGGVYGAALFAVLQLF
nr:exopolysaccharide biosynthesis protein [Jiella sp. LLJ827]